jgi:putative intracellular protease/amidase
MLHPPPLLHTPRLPLGHAPMEDRLRERGGQFEAGSPWQPHVVVDGLPVTGQNPASSHATAEATPTALHVPA